MNFNRSVDDILVGLRVKVVCDDYADYLGKITQVTDEARPFVIGLDYLGETAFTADEFLILEDD